MSRRKLIWSPSAVQLVLLWHNYFVVACDETQKTLCGVLLGFAQRQKFEKKKWASAKFNTVLSVCPRTAVGSCSAAPVGEISNTLSEETVQGIDTCQSRFEQMFGNCVQVPLGFGKRSLKEQK